VGAPEIPRGPAGVSGTPGPRRPPYYEHLGGYSFDELKDYNRHSSSSPVHGETGQPAPRRATPGASSLAAGGAGSSTPGAAGAAFRAGGLRTRVYRSVTSNDEDDYSAPIYTTSV